MSNIQEIVIQKSRDEVWEIFLDERYFKEWIPSIKSLKSIQGEPGRPGAVTTFVQEKEGKVTAYKETILKREDPKLLSVERVSQDAVHKIEHTFEQLPSEATLWRIEHSIEYLNFKKYLSFFYRGALQTSVKKYQLNFKEFVESF